VPPETALRGRRPGDPGGTERYCVSLNQLSPVLGARRGNLAKTRKRVLTISLFRRCLPALEMGSLYPQFFVRALKNLIALKYVCKKARRNTLKIPAGVE
ncbi:hypothetical protein, partial [uncultured Rikenella sp.]|uniref:hypothetical protein n=3 Tax=uncultured Rikenella sp. TaxID=368003 RepID=UPI0026225685